MRLRRNTGEQRDVAVEAVTLIEAPEAALGGEVLIVLPTTTPPPPIVEASSIERGSVYDAPATKPPVNRLRNHSVSAWRIESP